MRIGLNFYGRGNLYCAKGILIKEKTLILKMNGNESFANVIDTAYINAKKIVDFQELIIVEIDVISQITALNGKTLNQQKIC